MPGPHITESFPRFRTHIARMREHGNTFCGHAPDLNDIEAMMAEVERLRSDFEAMKTWALDSDDTNDRLRAALKPFADYVFMVTDFPDACPIGTVPDRLAYRLTVGDLRRALAALEQRGAADASS